MNNLETWWDDFGKNMWIDEELEFNQRNAKYLGKWITTDFNGNVLQVKDYEFPNARLVRHAARTLDKNDPEWDNPLF